MSATLIILLVGALVATNCALVGSFLVLRRLALVGDAISHAVLPGIAVAFLLTGSRSPFPMIVGAAAVGVLTVTLVGLLARSRRMQEDASIGVVFPALFSVGVILISRYTAQVDLDLDCVLHGEIGLTPWDPLMWGDVSLGPRALCIGLLVLVLNGLLVFGLFKELKLASFDPELASSLGFSPGVLHYVLMTAVSVTVVASFESVGAILVVALLIVPPATAYLFTHRLSTLLLLAVGLGILASTSGYWLARWWDCSIAGAMATMCGVFFLLGFLFSPRNGLVARRLVHRELELRLSGQLVMLHLEERGQTVAREAVTHRFGWSERRMRPVMDRLLREAWVVEEDRGLRLTAEGARLLREVGTSDLAHAPAPE